MKPRNRNILERSTFTLILLFFTFPSQTQSFFVPGKHSRKLENTQKSELSLDAHRFNNNELDGFLMGYTEEYRASVSPHNDKTLYIYSRNTCK